jgi:hypothetical protein
MPIHLWGHLIRALVLAAALVTGAAPPCLAQTNVPTPSAATNPTHSGQVLALFDFAFFGKHANSIEPGDTAMAALTTSALRRQLLALPGVSVLDSAQVAQSAAQPGPQTTANGKPCNVIIACAREAAHLVGAPYAITGTVSKTSNLIWIFSGQLINVGTGELVMDDEYELKGDSRQMMLRGARVFAQRVAKKLGIPPAT